MLPTHTLGGSEMEEFSAARVFWVGRALRSVRTDCLVGSIPIGGDEPLFALSRDLDDRARNKALKSMKHAEVEFRKLGMQLTADTIKEVLNTLENRSQRNNFQWLLDQVTTIERLAEKEMKGNAFFSKIKQNDMRQNPAVYPKDLISKIPNKRYGAPYFGDQ